MRTLVLLAAFAATLAAPAHIGAQALDGIMTGIRNGGGWVSIPIVQGTAKISTVPLPTFGLTLNGCVRVWGGHSGTWSIRARDNVGEGSLQATSVPGQGVPFSHTFGVRSQLDFEFVWSEPRDTTLFLWVGLEREDDDRDACVPVR